MKTLILITQSYPYIKAAEQTFLNQEIPFLANSFDQVFILPQITTGEKVQLNYSNIKIDDEYSQQKNRISFRKTILNLFSRKSSLGKLILQEILQNPDMLFNIRKLIIMLACLKNSYEFSLGIEKFIRNMNISLSDTIFYSWWFTSPTFGLCIYKMRKQNISIVSRTHNMDLFEERHPFNYIPFRNISLKIINVVFPGMEAGTNYILNRYKSINTKIITSYLGSDDPGVLNSPSNDDTFRIVSCSSVVPLKRVDLIARGIIEVMKFSSDVKLEWIHFGDGECLNGIKNIVNETNYQNLNFIFKGRVNFDCLMEHYRNNPVDVFINVSIFEGQPVSIKEAISFGIPIIATDVGGNSEIATERNGILLPANPSLYEIADAIYFFIKNKMRVNEFRKNSRVLFLEKYNSLIAYPDFIYKLKDIQQNNNKSLDNNN